MVTIGDLLTATQKSDIIEKSLEIGDVYRMKLTKEEEVTPKAPEDKSRNKYFIIIGKDGEGNAIGFVLINSNINPDLSQVIKDLHYPIKSTKYSFLKKNSFVNCAELKIIGKEKFSSLFDDSKCKGKIELDDIACIIGALQSSPLIKPKQLKRFGLLPQSK